MHRIFFISLAFIFFAGALEAKAPSSNEPKAQTQSAPETMPAHSLLQDSATIGRVKIESYAAPHVLSVNVIKMFRGKGNPQRYMGGWLEGKNYSVDISGRAWKKTWDSMTPKYDPLGKEVIIFLASSGQLEGIGEIQGGKVTLICSRSSEACKVEPTEISLSSIKVEKPL